MPLGEALLAVAPAAPAVDEEKLEEAAARHRVLLMRTGAVIALTSIIAVAGALVIHLLAAGVIVVGLMIPWHAKSGGQGHPAGAEQAGPGGGALILGDPLAQDSAAPEMPGATPIQNAAAPLNAAVLPPLPPSTPVDPLIAVASDPMPLSVPAIDDPGTVHVHVPVPVGVKASPLPAKVAAVQPDLRSAAGSGTRGGNGSRAGGETGEPRYDLRAGDGTKTVGAGGRVVGGAGSGSGNGHDYGESAADRDAQILDNFIGDILPSKYRAHLPTKNVTLEVTVDADGTISKVVVKESCGIPEVDELYRQAAYAGLRCRPKVEAGQAVQGTTEFTEEFHSEQ